MSERGKSIASVVGEQLSAVSFVQDYVEFHFDGPVIRALNSPIVIRNGEAFKFPNSGSRDALCSFIGQNVTAIDHKEKIELGIIFLKGNKISIPLNDASYNGPESIHWCPTDGPIEVWQ